MMRRCPATRSLARISALVQPLRQENDDRLMSVNFGSARDGSRALRVAAWRIYRHAHPPHELEGWGSWPGVRTCTSFPETKQRVRKRKQACRRRMTAQVLSLKGLVSRIPRGAGSFERS